jgi:hypothetical protein
MNAADCGEYRQAAGAFAAQDLAREPAYNARGGVSNGGRHDSWATL